MLRNQPQLANQHGSCDLLRVGLNDLENIKFYNTSAMGLFCSYSKSDSNVQNFVNIFSF